MVSQLMGVLGVCVCLDTWNRMGMAGAIAVMMSSSNGSRAGRGACLMVNSEH